ncbi:hypothetical protein [Staphylococcus xylosus]
MFYDLEEKNMEFVNKINRGKDPLNDWFTIEYENRFSVGGTIAYFFTDLGIDLNDVDFDLLINDYFGHNKLPDGHSPWYADIFMRHGSKLYRFSSLRHTENLIESGEAPKDEKGNYLSQPNVSIFDLDNVTNIDMNYVDGYDTSFGVEYYEPKIYRKWLKLTFNDSTELKFDSDKAVKFFKDIIYK